MVWVEVYSQRQLNYVGGGGVLMIVSDNIIMKILVLYCTQSQRQHNYEKLFLVINISQRQPNYENIFH